MAGAPCVTWLGLASAAINTVITVTVQRDPFSIPERRYVAWPATARELAPPWWSDLDPLTSVARNCGKCDPDAVLADGDYVFFWARPGFVINVGSAVLAAVLNAIELSIISYFLGKLLLPAKKPVDPGDATSPTYGFAGLRDNARGDGNAIPVLYGRHRVTPPVINEYIRSSIDANGNPLSEYLALYLISEGPIQSIGGKTADGGPFSVAFGNKLATLQLNGQPAENFEGVEAHVRLGSLDQEAITEFANPVVSRDVGLTMHDPDVLSHAASTNDVPSGTTAIATNGAFPAANANITKWTDGSETAMVSFVGQDQANEFSVQLEFPTGLVTFNSTTGAAEPNSIIYQIRYVQVDDGGTPFGNYIVLPARQITLTRQGRLVIEDRQVTYNPSGYSAIATGLFVQSRDTAQLNKGVSVFIDTSKFTPPAPTSVKFSFTTWMRRRNAQADGTTNRIFQWFNTGATTGFRLNLVNDVGAPNSKLQFQFGNGSVINSPAVDGGGPGSVNLSGDTTNWHFVAVTYEAIDATRSRTKFYVDGALRFTDERAAQAVWDHTQQIRLMSDSESAPTLGYDGHMDETVFWKKTLTAYEVSALYNGGAPIGIDATNPDAIIGAEFDTNAGSSPNIGSPAFGFAAFTSGAGANWRFGTGTNAGTDPNLSASAGIVRIPIATNTKLRAKWRVDVMRLDTEDTNVRAISEVKFFAIQWRTYQQFTYPGMALLAVKVPATDQLNGSVPVVSVIGEGRLVPVWDGVDVFYPNMPESYSRVPSWVLADIATNRDYGIGDIYRQTDLDVAQLQTLATLASTRIYDNMPRQAILTAAYLDSAAEAVTFMIDTTTGLPFNLGALYGDVVRYKVAALPAHFPDVSTVATGRYIKPILAGLSPAPPAWLTTQAGLAAQEVVFIEWHQSTTAFYIYTRTTQSLGAGQTVYTVTSGSTTSNGLENHDVRFRFDGYFDRPDVDAWDAVIQVLQTARSAPLRIGSRLSVFVDDVTAPTMLVNQASIIVGSWRSSFQDIRDRPNAESAEFFDEDKNYERDGQPDEHPELVNPATQSGFRWRRMRIEGITRRSQIKRHLRRDLNAYFLIRRMVEFEIGIDGLPALPGDVIGVSSDIPGYGISGRIWEDATANNSIKLDRAITLAPATSYQIQVENAASETRSIVAVTQAAGTYAAGTAISVAAMSFIADKDDKYALGTVAQGEVKYFRLIETSLNPITLRLRCRCLEYNADVYDDDFGTLPAVQTTTLPAPSVPIVPPGVENLVVNETTVRGPDGAVSVQMLVSFTHPAETYHAVGGTDIYVSQGTHTGGRGLAQHVSALGPGDVMTTISYPFQKDTTYTIWVVPRTRDGATAYRAWASWAEITPSGLARTHSPPTNVRAAVAGEMVTFDWDDDDGALDHGATVEFRRGGWILGLPVVAAPAQARSTPPLTDWATGPANAFGVTEPDTIARVKHKTGQYSAAVKLKHAPSVVSSDGVVLAASEEDVW